MFCLTVSIITSRALEFLPAFRFRARKTTTMPHLTPHRERFGTVGVIMATTALLLNTNIHLKSQKSRIRVRKSTFSDL